MERDFAFEMAASNIRFGVGTTREVGMDLADLNVNRVMVLTDPRLIDQSPVQNVLESLAGEKIAYKLFDRVRIEPTDTSLKEAVAFAQSEPFDAFVAVGGGSTMDTAKVANLYGTYPPEDFLDYVNPPIGKGRPVPGPLKPLIALPTTAGTGSETTGVAIFDLEAMHAKTGIAHRRLKPTLGIVDPDNTRSLPPMAAASTGLDVLTHAIESYTAPPLRPAPPSGQTLAAARLPGFQPGQRHLGAGGDAHALRQPDPGRGKPGRRPGPRGHAPGRLLRRNRLRQRRGNPAPRHVVPGVGNGAGLLHRRLSVGPPHGAPRHSGGAQRAGGLPVHRPPLAPSDTCGPPKP